MCRHRNLIEVHTTFICDALNFIRSGMINQIGLELLAGGFVALVTFQKLEVRNFLFYVIAVVVFVIGFTLTFFPHHFSGML